MATLRNSEASSQHEPNDAETYDEWFRRQVEIGLKEADDPNTVWVDNDEVFRQIDERLKQRSEKFVVKKAS